MLQSTIERLPNPHLADGVGHFSHVNMLAVQVGFNIDVRKGMLILHYESFHRDKYMQFKS